MNLSEHSSCCASRRKHENESGSAQLACDWGLHPGDCFATPSVASGGREPLAWILRGVSRSLSSVKSLTPQIASAEIERRDPYQEKMEHLLNLSSCCLESDPGVVLC